MNRKAGILTRVCHGAAAEVLLTDEALVEYRAIQSGRDELSIKRRTQLQRYMGEFCRDAVPHLTEQQYKREETFADMRGRPASVYAFKPWKWRLYGVVSTRNGVKVFVGTKVDSSKKQMKANRALLRAAAVVFFDLNLQEIEVKNERDETPP